MMKFYALMLLLVVCAIFLGVWVAFMRDPLVSAAPGSNVSIVLKPAAGSVSVSTSNYFTVTYTNSSGVLSTAKYVGGTLALSTEASTSVTISAESSGSTSSEEWCFSYSNGCQKLSFVSGSNAQTFTYFYYDLLSSLVSYSVVGGGVGYSPPVMSYTTAPAVPSTTSSPQLVSVTLSSTSKQTIWALRVTSITVPATLTGSTSLERWATNVTSWTVGTSSPSNVVYFDQFSNTFSPTVAGGSLSYYSNQVGYTFTQFGAITTANVYASSTFWADSGSIFAPFVSTTGGSSLAQFSASPLTYGLVAYWPLNEGSGSTAFDLSGNGNTGTLINGPVWLSGSNCKFGNCLYFSGSAQYVLALGRNVPIGESPFTKSVWVYLPNGLTSTEFNREILCWGTPGITGESNCLRTGDAPNQLVNSFWNDDLTWTSTHIVNGWNLIVITYNGTVEKAYVNGVYEAAFTPSTPFVQPSKVYIGGGFYSGDNYFDHQIEDVRIYDYAWSASNVEEYYASSVPDLEHQIVSGGNDYSVTYYHQFLEQVSYIIKGGGVPTPPAFTYLSLGASLNYVVSTAPSPIWADSGSTWVFTNPASNSNAAERWYTNTPTGSVSSSATIEPVYYNQYSFDVDYAVMGGGTSYKAPVFSYVSAGSTEQFALSTSPVILWLDAGSTWNLSFTLPGSTANERWATSSATSGAVTSTYATVFTYYHQFLVMFDYAVVNGGAGYEAPSVVYYEFALPKSTEVGAAVWADAGSQYRFQNPLPGSTTNERWATFPSNGTVLSSAAIKATYYHQYLVTVNYNVVGGGVPPAPVFSATAVGTPFSQVLYDTYQQTWVDSGSNWSITNPLVSTSNALERWETNSSTSGTVSSATSITVVYIHQFYVTVQVNAQGGGSVSPKSNWYNAGSLLTLTAKSNLGWQFHAWNGSGQGSYTGPLNVTTLTVASPIDEEAVFYPGLTLDVASGGSVNYEYGSTNGTVNGGTTKTLYLPQGTQVVLSEKASPLFYEFVGWSGAISGRETSVQLVVYSPATVSASFGYNYVNLSVTAAVVIVIAAVLAFYLLAKRRVSRTP